MKRPGKKGASDVQAPSDEIRRCSAPTEPDNLSGSGTVAKGVASTDALADRFPPDQPKPISRQLTRFVPDAELQAALAEVRALPSPPPARIEAAVREAMALVREGQMKLLAAEAVILAAIRER